MDDTNIKRLTRLLALLTYLQSKRMVTAPELAQRFSVSVRTIYRDIRALEQAGVPIGTEEGKGYFLMDGYRLPPVQFTEEEANALITAEPCVCPELRPVTGPTVFSPTGSPDHIQLRPQRFEVPAYPPAYYYQRPSPTP